ncbi:MAG: hypothetical protein ACOC1U_07750 [Spirochaetota bacterium]
MKPRSLTSLTSLGTAALALIMLAGCASAPISVPVSDHPGPIPAGMRQFSAPVEPDSAERPAVTAERGSMESAYGCTLTYELHEPRPGAVGGEDPAEPDLAGAPLRQGLVVLGHGFLRDLETMRGWAVEWAARGTPTVVVTFCNSSWFSGNHARNAEDLVALAEHLRPGRTPVLYGGFSAGGLAALLAASTDERAIGFLGLDPVDSGELTATVDSLAMPALFLYGAPGACNAQSNMLPLMPPAQPRIALRIPYASHCSFENPYDEGCEFLCGGVEPEEQAAQVRETIHALATAWIEAQLGTSPDSRAVFHRRTLEELERTRRIEIISME